MLHQQQFMELELPMEWFLLQQKSNYKGLQLSFNSYFTKQSATNIPKRASAVDFMKLSNVAQQNSTGNPAAFLYAQALIDKYSTTAPNNMDVIDNDWVKLLFVNSGLMQNHNVTVNAGGEKLSMFTSLTFMDQKGIIPNTNFKRTDIRVNPDLKVSNKFSIKVYLIIQKTEQLVHLRALLILLLDKLLELSQLGLQNLERVCMVMLVKVIIETHLPKRRLQEQLK